MNSVFLQDCSRYNRNVLPGVFRRLMLFKHYPGLRALAVYRFGKGLQQGRYSSRWWPLYRALNAYIVWAYDIWLDLSADIGPGLYVGHLGNIHIARCRIGSLCSIGQSSHIIGPLEGEQPVLGDRVWFGSHATLEGSFQIGRGCAVSAGAQINRDLPERALCLGNPVRVVMMGYDNSAFLGLESDMPPPEEAVAG